MEYNEQCEEILDKLPKSAQQRMFPRNMINEMDISVNRLGEGNRMVAFPMLDAGWVLRVPKKSEEELIKDTGASTDVIDLEKHRRSNITQTELKNYEMMTVYLGGYIPTTTPFPGLDLEGTFRYYSKQKRIKIASHLNRLTPADVNLAEYARIVKFIKSVRKLIKYKHLIPDIGGANNVVLGQRVTGALPDVEHRLKPFSAIGKMDEDLLEVIDERSVYLIDINNVQPVISNRKWEKMIDHGFSLAEFARQLSRSRLYYEPITEMEKLPKGWLVDGNIASGDKNLEELSELEKKFITQITDEQRRKIGLTDDKHREMAKSVKDQTIYAPLTHPLRNEIIRTISEE
jgi:hypothetical protein